MPRKLRQLRADLLANGAYIASQKGSHQKWKHPNTPLMFELAGSDGKDAYPYQEIGLKKFLRSIRRENHD